MDFLIKRSQAGDERAFAALFDQTKNMVYRTAALMLGNEADAEDALQEVFLRVYDTLPSYDPARGAFTTWLHRVTVNHCLNRQRKRQPALLGDRALEHRARTPSPERLVEVDDTIVQALDSLSDTLRVVVVLRYAHGLSYAEISEVVGIPLGTVKSRLNAAMKTMRRALGAAPAAAPGDSPTLAGSQSTGR